MDEQKPILHYHQPSVSRRALAGAIILSALMAHVLACYGVAFVGFLIYRAHLGLMMYVRAPVLLPIEVFQIGPSHYSWKQWAGLLGTYVPVFCTSFFYLTWKLRRPPQATLPAHGRPLS